MITAEVWKAEARERFGDDELDWRFVCPVCKHVASVKDYREAGAPVTAVAFSCVGRWTKDKREAFRDGEPGPCNYAGGGLFRLNPVKVQYPDGGTTTVFAFA